MHEITVIRFMIASKFVCFFSLFIRLFFLHEIISLQYFNLNESTLLIYQDLQLEWINIDLIYCCNWKFMIILLKPYQVLMFRQMFVRYGSSRKKTRC